MNDPLVPIPSRRIGMGHSQPRPTDHRGSTDGLHAKPLQGRSPPGQLQTGRGEVAAAAPRRDFDRQLDAIDLKVIDLFAMVCEDLAGVTDALFSGSSEVTRQLAERDRAVDALYGEIEQMASRAIVLQAPVASDLRFLLTVLRVAPELERTHDLECEIVYRASLLMAANLSTRCRGLTQRMGELASDMWGRAADSWYGKDGSAVNVARRVGYLVGSSR